MKRYNHTTQKDWTATPWKDTCYYNVYPLNELVHKALIENSQDWELMPNVEIMKVYKFGNWMILIKELINNQYVKAIGFNGLNKWFELSKIEYSSNMTEATTDGWFERLNEHAPKLGLIEGVKFKTACSNYKFIVNDFSLNGYDLWACDGCLMDSDTGKWATPIEENKHEESYEYEMFFKSELDDFCKIDGWYRIATNRIKNPEKIQEYLKTGLLRIIGILEEKKPIN